MIKNNLSYIYYNVITIADIYEISQNRFFPIIYENSVRI